MKKDLTRDLTLKKIKLVRKKKVVNVEPIYFCEFKSIFKMIFLMNFD